MIEKWRESVDSGNVFGALLTDLSKAFDCLPHDLILAKLHAYGFDEMSLKLMHDYLVDNKEQKLKIHIAAEKTSIMEYHKALFGDLYSLTSFYSTCFSLWKI